MNTNYNLSVHPQENPIENQVTQWMEKNKTNSALLEYWREVFVLEKPKNPDFDLEKNFQDLTDREESAAIQQIFKKILVNPNETNQEKERICHLINEQNPNAWQWYIGKYQNLESKVYGSSPQNPNESPSYFFATKCHEGVLVQLKKLRNEKVSFDDMYKFFMDLRKEIALQTGTQEVDLFSKLRAHETGFINVSKFKDSIKHYINPTKQNLMNIIISKKLKPLDSEKNPFRNIFIFTFVPEKYKVYALEEQNPSSSSQFYVVSYQERPDSREDIVYTLTTENLKTSNEQIIINSMIFDQRGIAMYKQLLSPFERDQFFYLDKSLLNESIQHCPSNNIEPLMLYASTLFSELTIKTVPLEKEKIIPKIAELHWILANAMPTARGNAAISEMMIVTLLLYYNFMVTPYKEGVMGDMEALTNPKSQFIRNFPFLREKELREPYSSLEKKVIENLGGVEIYEKLPEFTTNPEQFIGATSYPEGITNEMMKEPLMQFRDQFNRRILLVKSRRGSPHIFFQRNSAGNSWYYISPDKLQVEYDVSKMPIYLFKQK
jgi:hypothetical protein